MNKSSDLICIDCSNTGTKNECIDCSNYSKENQSEPTVKTKRSNEYDESLVDISQIETFDGWNCQVELDLIENLLKIPNQTCIFDVNNIENDKLKAKQENLPADYIKHIEKWFGFFSQSSESIDELKLYNERVKLMTVSSRDLMDTDMSGPFRPQVHSKLYKSCNGYRYARGDFETEYDDTFEAKYIADLDYGSDSLVESKAYEQETIKSQDEENNEEEDENSADNIDIEMELKISILRKYNDLIRKRYELKGFVKKFGLLNEVTGFSRQSVVKASKTSFGFSNYLNEEKAILNFELPRKFECFFTNDVECLKFKNLLNYRNSLIQRLATFREYRSMGIKSQWEIGVYKKLKLKRLNRLTTSHMDSLLNSINRFDQEFNREKCKEWFKRFVIVEKNLVDKTNVSVSSHTKFKNVPLKIEHFPESEKLNDEEKEFCRVTRIQPTVYLKAKEVIYAENQINGSCSYSRARKIAKIDVNKTRVIHNFMLKVGLIKAS